MSEQQKIGAPAVEYPVTGLWWGDPDAESVPNPQPGADGVVRHAAFSVSLNWEESWELTRDVLLADCVAVEKGETLGDTDESNWLTYGVTFLSQFVGAVSLGCGMLTDIGGRLRAAIDNGEPILIPDWLAEQGAGIPPEDIPAVAANYLAQRLVAEADDNPKVASRAYGMLVLRAALTGDKQGFSELVNREAEPQWLVPGLQDACISVAVMAAGIAWGEEQRPSAVVEQAKNNWPGEKAADLLR